MILTDGQTKAYDKIMQWKQGGGDWLFRLAGYAGTGKTTLLQKIINESEDEIICCAPTGKAASVLQKKLVNGSLVLTVHKALYSPLIKNTDHINALIEEYRQTNDESIKKRITEEKEKIKDDRPSFMSKLRPGEYTGRIFIVDESSMITAKMAEDFQKSGARVLFVGDPGQLPPVGDKGWFGKVKADYTLDKVMRQALDNPIIRLSMEIRENNGRFNARQYADCEEVLIANKDDISFDHWLLQDQVLTGSNYLRRRINRFFRKQLGFDSKLPQKDERLICLKNDLYQYGFINGVAASASGDAQISDDGDLICDILYEDNFFTGVSLYDFPFKSHYLTNATEEPYALRNGLSEFDWAYAITVHKSQGSEWQNVLLADDGFFSNRALDRKKWLYTAVTRAKEKLTLVSA